MNRKLIIGQIVLLVVGVATWAVVGRILHKGGDLEFRPNVMHLKGSPYGRTLALAMRGPVDVYWHRGEQHDHGPGCDHDHGSCDHDHGSCDHDHESCDHDHGDCDHDHGDEHEGCDHAGHAELAEHADPSAGEALASMMEELSAEHAGHGAEHHPEEEDTGQTAGFEGVRPYLLDLIGGMRKAYHSRSNRRGESALHRAFVMGEAERRLALGYEMDPTNIACYGSYFLFLSEAMTRVEGVDGEERVIQTRLKAALQLSSFTVRYCLQYPDEAPAMVTGAVAAHDYLQLQLAARAPDPGAAAKTLQILDTCIGRYEAIREAMIAEGTWENFPEHRRGDMESAYRLVTVLREADGEVIERLSGGSAAAAETPPEEEMVTR